MKEFNGHSLMELGRRLNRFPQDVIPYNPVNLPSRFVGSIGDPHKIPYGRDIGTFIECRSDMPKVKGSVPEIAYKARTVSDREAEARAQTVTEKWIIAAGHHDHGLENFSMSRVLKWTVGSAVALGTASFVFTRF